MPNSANPAGRPLASSSTNHSRLALADLIAKHRPAYGFVPFEIRWTEPTPPEDIHADDVEFLPKRPKRLPSNARLAQMPKAEVDRVFRDLLVYNAVVMEGLRTGWFESSDDKGATDSRRNALRRFARLLERGQQFGVFRRMR